jgi:hypothetical protein
MWLSFLLPRRSPNRGSKPRADRRPATRFRPGLEELEDRWLPSQVGLTVTSLADSGPGTLRAAIQTADAGSHSDKFTIGISVTGTINLDSPLPDLNNSIAIQGPGAANLTVERAAGASFASAILTVDAGQNASLSGLTIANGNDGGIINYGALTVLGCIVSGNQAGPGTSQQGGGIYNYLATLTVENSTVVNNVARDGGGIDSVDGALTVANSSVTNNSAFAGGGIVNDGGTLSLSGSTVSGNTATFGGGINSDFGPASITGSTVSCNSATTAGGGIYNGTAGSLTVTNSTLSGNSAPTGGGISNAYGNFSGTVTVSGGTISGNSATCGGGIFNDAAGTLTVSNNSTLSGNSAVDGGGVYNLGTARLQDSALSGNTATEGGGTYNGASSTLTVQGSTFTGNSAGDSGGGIYNLGTAAVQQSTLSGNTAGSAGGGIFNGASAALTIDDSMVCGNIAPLGADLFNLGVATLNDSTVGVISP